MNTLLIIYSCLFVIGYGIGIVSVQTRSTTKRVASAIIIGILSPIFILKCIGEILIEITLVLGLLIKKLK